VRERVGDTAHVLDIEQLLARKPKALSGGQRQRVAMGRAIIRRPRVFLMDEPLSNLDAKLRVAMRGELTRLHQRYGTTTLYVTHDQIEAMTLGQRIAVLDRGRLQQVGTPDEVYRAPRNIFVAGFIGSPAMNLAHARLVNGADGVELLLGTHRWPVPEDVLWARPALRGYVDRGIVVGLRPGQLALPDDRSGPRLTCRAVTVESLGSEKNLLFEPSFAATTPRLPTRTQPSGESAAGALWTARLDANAAVRTGDVVELAVDLSGAYFFDPETTEALADADSVQRAAVSEPKEPLLATSRRG
jgi:multiple sugar transport system ATP-binding protein